MFYELVILMVVVLANLSNALDQARLSAVGLLAVAAVLQVMLCAQRSPQSHSLLYGTLLKAMPVQILSADRLYNVSDFRYVQISQSG